MLLGLKVGRAVLKGSEFARQLIMLTAGGRTPFPSLPFHSLLYSCSPVGVGPERLDRFLRLMTQNTWLGEKKCFCMIEQYQTSFRSLYLLKTTPIHPQGNPSQIQDFKLSL
jgi:hypothetical protein